MPDLKQMMDENCTKYDGPMADLSGLVRKKSDSQKNPKQTKKTNKRREQQFVVRDLITCLGLCHNVTPVFPDPSDKSVKEFQASSPDEVALVKFAD